MSQIPDIPNLILEALIQETLWSRVTTHALEQHTSENTFERTALLVNHHNEKMHISALILALFSANKLAGPLDTNAPSFPSSEIDNSTFPLPISTTTLSSLDKRRAVGGKVTT